ncbi:MAG: lamin tail domain-containing protein [Candidatus Pacebacteria bacterium]|nr:lamin tail domain-containing protein [Candidatus Paceibacterota bacterium]
MVRTVLWYLFWTLIVVLALIWFVSGGIEKIKAATGSFSSPLGSLASDLYGGGAVQLPWAIPIPQGADISNLTGTSDGSSQNSQSQTFGNASPYVNDIAISAEGATASDPQQEYLAVQNIGQSTIDISGWSLQSALTSARAYIPLAASFFRLGELNSQTALQLAPGGVAIVTTGRSPVGTSFRENSCSGYLEQLQQYTPPIQTQCPSPSDAASQAAQYGQSCASFVSSIPFCTFPQSLPSNLSTQCQAFIQNTLSYNGCVATHQNDNTFASNNWRVYLDGSKELWNNSHDTIRLLDSQGEVVAVTSY